MQGCIFSTFPSSSNYHCAHPYQYIAVISLATALILALWVKYLYFTAPIKKYLSLALSFLLIVFLGSIFGGILWALHTLLGGEGLRGMTVPGFFLYEIYQTLIYGWIALLKSFPLNFLALLFGGALVTFTARFFTAKK